MNSENSNVQACKNVRGSRATRRILDDGGGMTLSVYMGPAAAPEGNTPDGQPELPVQSRSHATHEPIMPYPILMMARLSG